MDTLEILKRVTTGSILRIWFLSHSPSQWIEARIIENHLPSSSSTDINRYLKELGLHDKLNSQVPSFVLVYNGMKLELQSTNQIPVSWPQAFNLDINLMWVPSQEQFQPQLRIPIQGFAAFPIQKVEVMK